MSLKSLNINDDFHCCHDSNLQYFVLFYFLFFFTQVQTPVTLCSGEWWSILVVRLAHSADLRSRLRHVSSAPSVAYSTGCSWVATHPGTNPARRCLTSVIWRELVCHRRLAVDIMWSTVQHGGSFFFRLLLRWSKEYSVRNRICIACGQRKETIPR